jgi:hypothetical protein
MRPRLRRSRWNDSDPIGTHAIAFDSQGCFPARTEHAAKAWQNSALECGEPGGPSWRESGLLGQRMVDESDEPQTAGVRLDRRFETGQGEAVDNRRRPIVKGGEHIPVDARRQLDKPDGALPGPKAFDDMAVVQISTGQLIEPAENDEDKPRIFSRSHVSQPGG